MYAYLKYCKYFEVFWNLTHYVGFNYLLQFTIPGGRHAMHHASLMQNAGAARVLRSAAAAATAPQEAKIFARIVLRNLEYHQIEKAV